MTEHKIFNFYHYRYYNHVLFRFLHVLFSGNVDPIRGNHHELDNEEPVRANNDYDTVGPVASGSKSSAPENEARPHVYAAVDKENRQGNTVCKGFRRQLC